MSRGHRDNYRARKKRGPKAFLKKAKAKRRKPRRQPCAWIIDFKCGKSEIIPLASPQDIERIAIQLHICSKTDCAPVKYHPQK